MFKDIILAITPSEVCECAADAAISFAQRFEANLILLHVYGLSHGSWGTAEYLSNSGETEKLTRAIQEYYGEKLKGVKDVKIVVVPGIPHTEILRIARKQDADLIVMGPHTKEYAERRSLRLGLAGSNLELVSQKARCPVMIVTRATPYGEHRFLNILVATDFSEQSECSVNYGGQLTRQYKANLTIFHALDVEPGQYTQDEIKQRIQETKERMAKGYEHRLRGIKDVTFECWEGKPSMEILKLARTKEADLILMAHHSKAEDPDEAVLGATVTQVALNSNCPTMSINRHFDLRCGLMYDQSGAAVAKTGATA